MVTAQSVKNSFVGIAEHSRTLCEVIDFHNRRFAEKVKAGMKSGRTLKRFEIMKEKVIAFLKAHYHVSDKPLFSGARKSSILFLYNMDRMTMALDSSCAISALELNAKHEKFSGFGITKT
jgi:hypothetical protein